MDPVLSLLAPLLAQETTSTTSVPRITGEPLDTWVLLGSSLALLVVILAAGFLVRRRLQRTGDGRR